jgi:NADPH:quinone reductase-like Zn-dependent oxidoreductase
MKGVIFEKQGAEPKVVDDLEKPSPGPEQLLVKSIWTAINPVWVRKAWTVNLN